MFGGVREKFSYLLIKLLGVNEFFIYFVSSVKEAKDERLVAWEFDLQKAEIELNQLKAMNQLPRISCFHPFGRKGKTPL